MVRLNNGTFWKITETNEISGFDASELCPKLSLYLIAKRRGGVFEKNMLTWSLIIVRMSLWPYFFKLYP